MKIAILNWRDTCHPQAGGAEVVADSLATGLTDLGHDVTLIAGGAVTEHPYRAVRGGGDLGQYLTAPIVFHRQVGPVDVVLDISNGLGFFAPLWQRAPVVGLVHHVHLGQWKNHLAPPLAAVGHGIERWIAPRIYGKRPVIAVSRSTSSGLTDLGYRNVTVVEMGVTPVDRVAQPSITPRFLVLGRLVPHKQVELALAMWEKVRPRTGGELVVVGDGPLRSRLESVAGESVRFTGKLDLADRDKEICSSWLLVHPAHHEGWGTVVMEAASVSVPTLGFDVEGLRDSVVPGETGVLAADEEQFVSAWIRLGEDSAFRNALGDAARRRAESYSWSGAVRSVEGVLERASNHRRRGRRFSRP